MLSLDLESRIVEMARQRGILEGTAPGVEDVRSLLDPHALKDSTLWGPRLDAFIGSGQLSLATVEALAFEAVYAEGGEDSWMAPPGLPAPPGPPSALEARFQDLQLLGEGATAQVYKAFDGLLQRFVALKFLKSVPGDGADIILAEARAQAQIDHPNVCRIYEVGEVEGRGFIAMLLVEGPRLTDVFRGLGTLERVRLARDLAKGVHAAHKKGLVHLDLKPGNVLLQPQDRGGYQGIIMDFGMMRPEWGQAQGFCPMGTPPYSSPEQIRGDSLLVDRRSDIYSLGVLLYVLLAEAYPFEAQTFPALLHLIQEGQPVPLRRRRPDVSEDLEAILSKCMSNHPAHRYATAEALSEDLERFLDGHPVLARKSSAIYGLRKWVGRNRGLAAATLLGVLAVLSTGAAFGRQAWFEKRQGEWGQRFEQEVNELEAFLGRVYSQPYHDLTPEFARAKERIRALERALQQGDRAAQGPAHYALGRAYALVQEQASEAHFQKAWDLGFKTAPVRWEKALRLIQRYRGLQGQVPDDAVDQARYFAYFTRTYLEPAKRILAESAPGRQERGYTLARLALAEAQGDYAQVLQLIRKEREGRPWDYQAWLDEADLVKDKAWDIARNSNLVSLSALLAGRQPRRANPQETARIQDALAQSEMLLKEALRLAPSSPDVHRALAGRWHLPSACALGDPDGASALTEQWLQKGLAIAPGHRALLGLQRDHRRYGLGMRALEQGQDPLRVLRPDPSQDQDVWEHVALSALKGERPGIDWKAYLDALDQANAGLPEEEDGRWECATRPLLFDEWCIEGGQDPTPLLRRVMAAVTQGKGKLSEWAYPAFMASCHLSLARYHVMRGEDAKQALQEAEGWLFRLRASKPVPGLSLARMEAQHGRLALAGNPDAQFTERLRSALAQLARSLINASPGREAFRAHLEMADGLLDLLQTPGGNAPPDPVADARKHVLAALRHLPASTEAFERLAQISLLEARSSRAPFPKLREALAHAERALIYSVPLTEAQAARGLRRPFPPLMEFPHQGRTLRLRSDIEAEWARRTSDERLRATWKARSERSLESAHRSNANLKGPEIIR